MINEQWCNYGYNYYHVGSSLRGAYGGTLYPPAKLAGIAKPTETILMVDVYTPNAGPNGEPRPCCIVNDASAPYVPHARHNGGLNVCWVDGHVSWMRIKSQANPWAELGNDVAPSFFDRF